ncbi:MAG TPA: GNAT family N-acetyltransferase [Kofleriaceae bacterium]|nr:GNAT family N-acetyltransferase [Kofleriaceae bacterium]
MAPPELPTALATRDGDDVELAGRYEADDARAVLVLPDGAGRLALGARADAERDALRGRQVRARGRLRLGAAGAPDDAPALDDAVVTPDGELPLYDPVPHGLPGERRIVEVVVTSLEMRRAPAGDAGPAPDGTRVIHAQRPGVRFYRYLYDAVGAPWHWYDRKRLRDDELAAIVDDPRVEVHVAYRRGTPAGYVELDRRTPGECEVAYFGLVPEAIGGGLGTWLLRWGVHEAWRADGLTRLWVHTCTLDHPAALPVYRKVGFTVIDQERHRQYVAVAP